MELTKALRIAQNPCWFQFAADLLAKMALSEAGPDRNGVLAAVRRNGFKLEFAPEELKKDRQIILAAVKHNGAALQFAAEELKKDRQIVCAAVKQNGAALRIDLGRTTHHSSGSHGASCSNGKILVKCNKRPFRVHKFYTFRFRDRVRNLPHVAHVDLAG